MLNKIIDAISIKLNQVFGDTVEIYTDQVKQGFEEPCFFIALLNSSQEQIIGARYHRESLFDIHYFPAGDNREINDVADMLLEEMEYLDVAGDLVRGTGMHHEVVDGVLHFFVSYNLIVRKDAAAVFEPMESVAIDTTVKE